MKTNTMTGRLTFKKKLRVQDSIVHMDYSEAEFRVMAHMAPANPEPITLVCESCGKTDKRPAVDPYTGHAYNSTFTYRCMECGGEMELIEELGLE